MAHADRPPLRHHLLWTDLECTGSDYEHDEIIEIGCVLTTYDLNILGEFTAIVQPKPYALGRMMQNSIVRAMHDKNGLLADVLDVATEKDTIDKVTRRLLAWLDEYDIKDQLVIAGSGVGHYDSRFIKRYMPQLQKRCKYWVIDIGNVRRAWDMWVGTDVSAANDRKTHRALDDAYCHLDEARAFADLWNALEDPHPPTGSPWGPDSPGYDEIGQ